MMLDPGQAQAGSSTAITVYDVCTLEDAVVAATGHPRMNKRLGQLTARPPSHHGRRTSETTSETSI